MSDRELLDDLIRMVQSSLKETTSPGPLEPCTAKEAPDIVRYVSGGMSESERIEAERHMRTCRTCLRNIGRTLGMIWKGKGREIAEEERSKRLQDRTMSLLDRLDDESNVLSSELKERYRSRVDLSAGKPVPEESVGRKSRTMTRSNGQAEKTGTKKRK